MCSVLQFCDAEFTPYNCPQSANPPTPLSASYCPWRCLLGSFVTAQSVLSIWTIHNTYILLLSIRDWIRAAAPVIPLSTAITMPAAPRQESKEKAKKAPQTLPQHLPKTGRKGKETSDFEKGVIIALWWV